MLKRLCEKCEKELKFTSSASERATMFMSGSARIEVRLCGNLRQDVLDMCHDCIKALFVDAKPFEWKE